MDSKLSTSKDYTLWIILGLVVVLVLFVWMYNRKDVTTTTKIKEQKIKDIELLLAKVNFDMDNFQNNYLKNRHQVDYSMYEGFDKTKEGFKNNNDDDWDRRKEYYKIETFDNDVGKAYQLKN